MFKTGCLAVLNGGGVGNPRHLDSSVKEKWSLSGKPLSEFNETVCKLIKSLPLTQELVNLTKTMHFDGHSHLMNTTQVFTATKNKTDCCSAVMAGGEVSCLSFLIEFIARQPIEMLPVSLEHDGVLILTHHPLSSDDIECLVLSWRAFLMTVLN